ncbi:MAG TPA: hydantoinase/oxoprolinase family protein [Burkholderiales bacterium]|nr:hydantoinase/oxoprolinase family protein [Burkholderiales bacterium]
MLSIGIDTGGTFTDLAVYDAERGDIRALKVPSTVGDPSEAIIQVLEKLGTEAWANSRIVHGTTVATNMVLERKGAALGIVTTEGFRDLLEIGRTRRASPGLFNTKFIKAPPLVPRVRRFEVRERVKAGGDVLLELDRDSVREACDALSASPPEAIVVCLLHSYANASHEKEVRRIIEERLDGVPVVLSSDVVPEYREFERLTTSVINAYVLPRVKRYLASLQSKIGMKGERLYVMASNGGVLTAEAAGDTPSKTILSGPAGGVNGAMLACGAAGVESFITCDMGGTSTDVALVDRLKATMVQETMIAGLPLKLPQLDINTVGAGGGSIAWRDVDGSLRVGPQSAGAEPGPAAYGRGGTQVTVTDANLVLGRIAPGTLLGGELTLDRRLSNDALRRLADSLNYPDVERLAEGVIKLAVTRMASAIREISIERGHDPRQFALLPMGGAGPMHATELAEELGIREVFVPRFPGNLSAVGLIGSDIRYDFARTVLSDARAADAPALRSAFAELADNGRRALAREGFGDAEIRIDYVADMRYRGQAFDVNVPVASPDATLATLIADFEVLYERRYGHRREGKPIDIVTARVAAHGLVARPVLSKIAPQKQALDAALKERRPVYVGGRWHRECPVFQREQLGSGVALRGPAIIEEYGSTTVLPETWRGAVDDLGNLRLQHA